MALKSKRSTESSENSWASNESLSSSKGRPGRPRNTEKKNTKNIQLRLPEEIIEQIDKLIEGEGLSRHSWLVRSVKDSLKRNLK
ncbi:MAG: ribbon-helix-helix protein, CopG family [Lentisphaeraceae bacterium]|nr:ribbon-helix-helix protein, CopG family [Lentisphaeraceae bacterium]